jgi:ABC-type uncharacterized transport system permease subunit
MDVMASILSVTFLAQVLRISVPYVLAALGGVISERCGIVNVALEGMMLQAAFGTVVATYYTGNPVMGVFGGLLAGALTGLLHGLVSIRFKADQIISGVAINLLAVGLTKFLLRLCFHSSSNSPRIEGLPHLSLWKGSPTWESLGLILGNPLLWVTVALVWGLTWVLFRTVFGLRLRAVGEHPKAAATLGISVSAMRYTGVILSGLLAGLGGVWLALDQHQFTDGMTNGRGFIALAAVIFGRWHPLAAAGACLIFGLAEALQIVLQGSGTGIPTQWVQMLPYVLTLAALALQRGASRAPAALGKAETAR